MTPSVCAPLLLLALVAVAWTAPTGTDEQPPCAQQRLKDWKERSTNALDALQDTRYQLDKKLEKLGDLASQDDREDRASQLKDAAVDVLREFFQYGGLIFQCPDEVKPVVYQIGAEILSLHDRLRDALSEDVPSSGRGSAPSGSSPNSALQAQEIVQESTKEDDIDCIVGVMISKKKSREEAESECQGSEEAKREDDIDCIVGVMVSKKKSREEAESECQGSEEAKSKDGINCIVHVMVFKKKSREGAESDCRGSDTTRGSDYYPFM